MKEIMNGIKKLEDYLGGQSINNSLFSDRIINLVAADLYTIIGSHKGLSNKDKIMLTKTVVDTIQKVAKSREYYNKSDLALTSVEY